MPVTSEELQPIKDWLLKEKFPAKDDPALDKLTPANALEYLTGATIFSLSREAASATALSRVTTERNAALALSRDDTIDPELANERRIRVAERITRLGGTEAWTKRATDLLCGSADAPNSLMLSRVEGGDDVRAVDFVGLLADFKKRPEAGEHTGLQFLELARQVPGDDKGATDDPKAEAAEWEKKQLAARGLQPA